MTPNNDTHKLYQNGEHVLTIWLTPSGQKDYDNGARLVDCQIEGMIDVRGIDLCQF